INLLASERKVAKKAFAFQSAHKITLGCGLILVLAAVLVGWRYRALQQESARLDADIAAGQAETQRLRTFIQQVQQFEQQKGELQQRVVLIEQLRKSQTHPVHMLDEISRALPPMVWLTELKQSEQGVLIEGRCLGLTNLSDFVAALEGTGYFKKSIEIMNST